MTTLKHKQSARDLSQVRGHLAKADQYDAKCTDHWISAGLHLFEVKEREGVSSIRALHKLYNAQCEADGRPEQKRSNDYISKVLRIANADDPHGQARQEREKETARKRKQRERDVPDSEEDEQSQGRNGKKSKRKSQAARGNRGAEKASEDLGLVAKRRKAQRLLKEFEEQGALDVAIAALLSARATHLIEAEAA